MSSTVSTLIRNLVGAEWRDASDAAESLPIFNPAAGEVIEQVPLCGAADVDAAVRAAAAAYVEWSRTCPSPSLSRSFLLLAGKVRSLEISTCT
jgi:acyl-CoA reductase-like NAD-dependent aldehyde dehydrogenase